MGRKNEAANRDTSHDSLLRKNTVWEGRKLLGGSFLDLLFRRCFFDSLGFAQTRLHLRLFAFDVGFAATFFFGFIVLFAHVV